MSWLIIQGDAHHMPIADNSIDAIVTDPPYLIGFMSRDFDKQGDTYADPRKMQQWHYQWAVEALRVLRPGGHLLAFGGTRTSHRLTCALEDTGFEIRDSLMWVYSQGFPKGQDVAWELHKKACIACGVMVESDYGNKSPARSIPETKHDLRFVRATYLQTPVYACAQCGQVLQPFLSEQESQALRGAWSQSKTSWPEQSCVEGGHNLETPEGQLQGCSVCQMSHGILADGAQRWICDGASSSHGSIPWQVTNQDGSRPSYRPQSCEQLYRQFEAFSLECRAQTFRGWNVALKPAYEPIILARKPLSEPIVAQNVLRWGTGALNIAACRIGSEQIQTHNTAFLQYGGQNVRPWQQGHAVFETEHHGRWPANFIMSHADQCEQVGVKKVKNLGGVPSALSEKNSKPAFTSFQKTSQVHHLDADGLETVEEWRCVEDCPVRMLDEQSGEISSGAWNGKRKADKFRTAYSVFKGSEYEFELQASSGGASRFFYTAKVSRSERGEDNNHPTVKPIALMRYLCRLICPPCGIILDPFMGSGSTLIAAMREGFSAIGIEKDPSYVAIAQKRIVRDAPLLNLIPSPLIPSPGA